jgi:hypothetical protein
MNRRFCTTNAGWLISVVIALAIVAGIFALARLDVTGSKGSGLSEQFVYDVKDLAKIDPNLILYEEIRRGEPISTGFTNARGLAVGLQESIYVAGDKAIRSFSESGQMLAEIDLTDTPRCLTAANDGKIYIGMKDHIEVYACPDPRESGGRNGQRKRLASWQSLGDNAVLTSIAVSKNDVFVADAGNRIVLHYDTTGKLINRIGEKDPQRNTPGFVIPSPYFDLAVGRDGLLRAANPGLHRVEAYTFDGDLEFWWGKFSSALEGFCGCCNPVNFALLEDGSFITCEKGLVRVKIYNPEGAFVGVVAGPEQLVEGGASHICMLPGQCQAGGFDVAVDSGGRVLVLDTMKSTVRVFTRKEIVKPALSEVEGMRNIRWAKINAYKPGSPDGVF